MPVDIAIPLRPVTLAPLPEDPLVSVLLASYNYERYLPQAIDSVLEQTYSNLEIIVCDDGSTDGSADVAKTFADRHPRIRLIEQRNRGVGAALNTAFGSCKGDVVCLLDADDYFASDKIAEVVTFCQRHRRCGFVQHAMEEVDGSARFLRRLPQRRDVEQGWIAPAVVRRGGRWRSMPASALAMRREVAELLFPLPEAHLRSAADAFIYILAPLLTEVGFIDRMLSTYRLHGANLTGASSIDTRTTAKQLDDLSRVFRAIEARASEKAPGFPKLEISHHLTYVEQTVNESYLREEAFSDRVEKCAALLRMTVRDDLYAPSRKMASVLAYGIGLIVPARYRARWLSWVLGGSGLRRLATRWSARSAG